jgi:hypothetical protein
VLLIDELDKVDHAFEAQAFKRSCSCFGLGRYLYHFTGVWVDIDERKRPKTIPKLFGWATPQGWREGQRPCQGDATESKTASSETKVNGSAEINALTHEIGGMSVVLGKRLYRGILKAVAKVWSPTEIHDMDVLRKAMHQMRVAEAEVRRLDAALNRIDPGTLVSILRSLRLYSLDQVDSLEVLERIVLEVEQVASVPF